MPYMTIFLTASQHTANASTLDPYISLTFRNMVSNMENKIIHKENFYKLHIVCKKKLETSFLVFRVIIKAKKVIFPVSMQLECSLNSTTTYTMLRI